MLVDHVMKGKKSRSRREEKRRGGGGEEREKSELENEERIG